MSQGIERRHRARLPDSAFDAIKERVIEELCENPPRQLLDALDARLSERVYAWVGKRTIALALYVLGTVALGAFAAVKYLEAKGVI